MNAELVNIGGVAGSRDHRIFRAGNFRRHVVGGCEKTVSWRRPTPADGTLMVGSNSDNAGSRWVSMPRAAPASPDASRWITLERSRLRIQQSEPFALEAVGGLLERVPGWRASSF